jgi:lipase chaperone LimK
VFKKLFEQFRTGVSATPNQFEKEVIRELQNTMDRLHAENVQLKADYEALFLKFVGAQKRLATIATIADYSPNLASSQPSDNADAVIRVSTNGTIA